MLKTVFRKMSFASKDVLNYYFGESFGYINMGVE